MASIKFVLKSNTSPAGIYIRLTDSKAVDVMAKTKYSIDPEDWSKTKEQPKNLKTDYFKNLNSTLTDLKGDLLKHYNTSRGKVDINTKWLKEFLNPTAAVAELPSTLIEYFDIYTESKKKLVSPNSIKKYNVIKNKLVKLQDELVKYRRASKRDEVIPVYENYIRNHSEILLIQDVGLDFQKVFEYFCRKHNYAHNTATMELRFIKTVCRHANQNGLEINKRLEHIENKYEAVESIYLTPDELSKIKEVQLNESLDNVRDWLLISCYSGQRISDFLRFNKNMLRHEVNRQGNPITLIEFVQVKTGKIMTLPLHKEIVAILNKRNGDFPQAISDQKYNDYMKKVCKAAGINELITGSKKTETFKDSGIFRKETGTFKKWELVTSHIGRRSFATNFYGIIPTSLLIAATGHSTEAMFLNYIGKSSSDRAKELAEYF